MQRAPVEQALPLIFNGGARPRCLSRTAVYLVQDTLAKGSTHLLAKAGGWRHERHLRGNRVAEGRLWGRTPPQELGLVFSRQSLEFLLWITATKSDGDPPTWQPRDSELTLGDRLLHFFAYQALHGTGAAATVGHLAAFPRNGLCRLAFPEDFTSRADDANLDFALWTTGAGSYPLEALEPYLTRRWINVEKQKGHIADWRAMIVLGQAQERILQAFLDSVEGANRLDLARFLLQVAARLLHCRPRASDWVGGLDLKGVRVADRVDSFRAALILLRQLDRLRQWERQARVIGYFDDGYNGGQLWKALWESCDGESLWENAQHVIRELELV
jgi:hypothetical protein